MKLLQVSRIYKDIIHDYKNEYLLYHDRINGGCGLHHYQNLDDWFLELDKIVVGKSKLRVQSIPYICMVSDKMVGMIDIRLKLPKEWYSAGHIGYSIRPTERNKGYATLALKEAVRIAKQFDVDPIITCLKSNIPSQKVITNNGGVFLEEIIDDGEEHLVYKFS